MKAIVLFALLLDSASASCAAYLTTTFEKARVPDDDTMIAWESFYVSDVPAVVEFKAFKVEGRDWDPPIGDDDGLRNVQMIVVPYSDFANLKNDTSYCKHPVHSDEDPRFANTSGVVYLADAAWKDAKKDIKQTGVHVLLLSNCMHLPLQHKNLSFTGNVRLQNAHGYLSGLDIGRRHANGWLASIYGGLTIALVLYIAVRRGDVSKFHFYLLAGLFIGLVSTGSFYVGFSDCNVSGEPAQLIRMGETGQAAKAILTGTYIVLSMMGWGRPPKDIGNCATVVLLGAQWAACLCMYSLQDLDQLRHYKFVESNWVYAPAALSVVFMIVTAIWVGLRLASSIRRCNLIQSGEALRFFKRLCMLCVCALCMVFVNLFLYITDDPRKGAHLWFYHSWIRDWIPEFMMLAFFFMMMHVFTNVEHLNQFEELPKSDEDIELVNGKSDWSCQEGPGFESEQDRGDIGASDLGAMTIGVPLE